MARPGRPERNRTARSFRQLRRFHHIINSDRVFGTHSQLELSLQQARYEAAHARRQYDAVDPANRLVAGELERRWNEALQAVAKLEGEIAALIARRPPPLGEPERQQLVALGADLERAWLHPAATPQRASVSFALHSRRSSCAGTAQSSMRSCT